MSTRWISFFLLIKITNFTAVFTLEDELQRTFQTALSSTQPNNNGEKILMNRPYFIIKKPWKQNDCLVINYFISEYLKCESTKMLTFLIFWHIIHVSCFFYFHCTIKWLDLSSIHLFIYCCIILKTETFFSDFGLSSEKISWFLDENLNNWFITNLFFNAYSNDQFYRAHIPRGAQRPGGFQGQRRHASLLRPIRSRNAQRHLDEGRETPGSWRSKVCTILFCECPRLVKMGYINVVLSFFFHQ